MGHKFRKERLAGDRIATEAAPRVENRYAAAAAVCGFLLLAVALAFGRTVGYGFVNYDDDIYVIENPHLTHGLAADEIAWAFTATRCNNWHPLTWLSYLVDSQLYGLAPWGYHLTNVLLHAASAILLFLVLRRMTGDLWPSALVAAVFAIHPLRVESVVWVAERKDVLSGLFFMLTLAAYVGYVRRPFSLVRYGLVVLLFALGLMAKPMLVTLPLVLLLLDYWPLDRLRLGWPMLGEEGRWGGSCTATPGATVQLSPQPTGSNGWRLVVEKLPLLALSAASCVATSVAQGKAIARIESLPLGSRAANALVSSAAYIGQLFYPVGLAVFYPHPGDEVPIGQIVGAVILLTAITAVAAVCWRRWAWLPVGWLWYLGMLVPVIGLVQVGAQSMANRYTYLPQIGLVMALAWSVKRVVRTWPERGWVCGVGAAAVLIGLMGCTWRQTTYWSSSEALWRHTLSCTASSAKGHYNFGVALVEAGKIDEAIAEHREALNIKPDLAEAHNGLGIALARRKDYAEAIAHYRKAIALKPDLADVYGNLGLALFQQERWAEAIEPYEKAMEFNPEDVKTRCNLATALARQGRTAEAIEQFQEVLKRQPKYAEAHSNLGLALAGAGRGEEAIAQFQQALESKPDYAEAHNNLGLALAYAGRIDDAITHFQKASELSPSLAMAHENLAMAFSRQGKMPEAIAQWREVIRLQPKNQFAIDQLARALAAKPGLSPPNVPRPSPPPSDHP